MLYINYRYDLRSEIETIDTAESYKEARQMVREYRMSDSCGHYWTSTRATRAYYAEHKN